MSVVLSWLRDNVWPVVLAIATVVAFRFGKQTREVSQQKEKINARNETIKRQKAVADAKRHRVPDAVTRRLRDGNA